jgi:phosphoribosylformimino-5-aminoimidazole carboxamide ribonucleotide (ProFAR) isomerase
VEGAIIGTALYVGSFTLEEAMGVARSQQASHA